MIRLTYPIFIGIALLAAPLASAARKETKARVETESKEVKPAVDSAPRDSAKEAKERAAKKACLTGDPVKGVELLTDLFIDTNDPTYIFNQGRCYEQSNRYEEAIGRFREYLRKAKGAPAAERADAEKHIADCQALSEKKQPTVPAAAGGDSASSAAGHGGSPGGTQPPIKVVVVQRSEAESGSSGSGLRAAGLVTIAVGVVALAGGAVLNVKYNNMIDGLTTKWDNDVESSSGSYKTMAIIGYSAGAVCLVGGAIMYVAGRSTGQTVVAPTVVAGGPGVAFSGGF